MKSYIIAGLKVHMDTWGRTERQAQIYQAEPFEEPDIIVRSWADEFQASAPNLTRNDCEYMATGYNFYRQLPDFDGMLLHSSAVMMDGRAYLFSATSGTGKSTHTALWRSTFGEDRAQIINDDKPAIRLEDGVWYAYGTPWSGKATTSLNVRVPIAGICMLRRGEENKIEPFTGPKAVFEIMDQTLRLKNGEYRSRLLQVVDQLVEKVPVYKLYCNMDPEAARLSYGVMSGNIQL